MRLSLAHAPTWFLLIGYPIFWIILFFHGAPNGITHGYAWWIWIVVAIGILIKNYAKYLSFDAINAHIKHCGFNKYEKLIWLFNILLVIGILLISGGAASRTLHLMQEHDSLHYHYTLPRQHLILGSFAHIPWAADDLFVMPIDMALSPFWFSNELLNKWPQYFFLLGLLTLVFRLMMFIAPHRPWAWAGTVLVVMGSHGLGIQMGTAMLDIVILYLFVAWLDSLRRGDWLMSVVEFTFLFWSKPFMPIGIVAISLTMLLVQWVFVKFGWKIERKFLFGNFVRLWPFFLVMSLLVAGPFLIKSIYYAATPLYPFFPGILGSGAIKNNPIAWESLKNATDMWMNQVKNQYGYGYGVGAFIKHWWLLAVPSKGVNNAYDYPLGLGYLLMLGPFLIILLRDIVRRRISQLALLIVVMWMCWWFGTQQSRFLYIPLVLMFMVTMARLWRPGVVLLSCLSIALLLNLVSLWRAHGQDLFRSNQDILRLDDRTLMIESEAFKVQNKSGFMPWSSHDAAFAQVPIVVRKENLPHTVAF